MNILNVCLNTEQVMMIMMMMMARAPMSSVPRQILPVKWKVKQKCAQTSHFCLTISHLGTCTCKHILMCQCTNRLVSDSHGLVYFALGQVEFIRNLHNGQEEVLAEFLGKFISFSLLERIFWAC